VARRLRELDEDVCFIVGPVEAERWSPDELDAIRDEFPLIESPSPNELLGLLAGARVLIGNDAGPAHLAALLGTRTVTIFGTTSPSVWRPLGPGARHIKGDPTSSPTDWGIDPAHVAATATSTHA
jgi:ADP-heptose:LPS heptosyltransferase